MIVGPHPRKLHNHGILRRTNSAFGIPAFVPFQFQLLQNFIDCDWPLAKPRAARQQYTHTHINICIPASSNVCKIIAFSGIIAGGTFFCCQTIFAFFVISMCLPILKQRKTPTKRRQNPTKRRKKSRAQNVQTETAKKTGNDEN